MPEKFAPLLVRWVYLLITRYARDRESQVFVVRSAGNAAAMQAEKSRVGHRLPPAAEKEPIYSGVWESRLEIIVA